MRVAAGARPDARDKQGTLPLHRACSALQSRTVELLLDSSPATVNAADHEGETPLHIVVGMGEDAQSTEIARFLVAHGADLEAKNKAGESPLALFGGKLPSSIASVLEAEDEEQDEDAMDT